MPQPLFGRGLNALQIKLIAFISMVIDHTAVAIPFFHRPENEALYDVMRGVGRLAFPLFCFFVAEGAVKSQNRWRYLRRLGVLALLCEIPFDLVWAGRFPLWSRQNTVVTLFLGLLGITLFEECRKRLLEGAGADPAPGALLLPLAALLPPAAAWLLKTDYGAPGVLLIYGFYLGRTEMSQVKGYPLLLMLIMGGIWVNNPFQLLSLLAFFLIFLYNDNLGKRVLRYAFYGGYFGHLVILGILRKMLT